MHSDLPKLVVLLALSGLCGCQSPRPVTETREPVTPAISGNKTFDSAARANSLALLDDLLDDEKNLGLVLIIKRESPDLKRLVKDIGEVTGHGAAMVKSLAKKDSGLQLEKTGLPAGETAARKAISKTKKHLLLHSKGAEFEFQLLLTQVQALSYGAHLASVAAENEPAPGRARKFSELSARLEQLYERVIAMLRKNNHNTARVEYGLRRQT